MKYEPLAHVKIPHPCYRAGCAEKPTRYHPPDTFAKCETHYREDLAAPWGTTSRGFDDATRVGRPAR